MTMTTNSNGVTHTSLIVQTNKQQVYRLYDLNIVIGFYNFFDTRCFNAWHRM